MLAFGYTCGTEIGSDGNGLDLGGDEVEPLGLMTVLIFVTGKELVCNVIPFDQGARGILNGVIKSPFQIQWNAQGSWCINTKRDAQGCGNG